MGSGYVTMAHKSPVNVGATTTKALDANAAAKYRLFQNNDTAETMWLMVGAAAEANKGIRLAAGASYEMSRQKGNMDTRQVNAIHGGEGDKVLLVTEGV